MSDRDFSRIQALVDRPTEGLSIELKRWIDPDRPEGAAKIVKAALALRNHGGGDLVIGFDDDTHEPDRDSAPQDVEAAFHIDKIQALISRYASEPFEVSVEFPEREGQPYPVISIPPGVKTPVAAKADLRSADGTTPPHQQRRCLRPFSPLQQHPKHDKSHLERLAEHPRSVFR